MVSKRVLLAKMFGIFWFLQKIPNFFVSFKIRRSQQSQFCHHSVRIPHKAV